MELEEFLSRPLFCFFAQQSKDGPRVSPLWFLWESRAIWNIAQLSGRSYPDRVKQHPRSAIAIVDFDVSTGRVEHVGMRGDATLKPFDRERARRLLQKYLGSDKNEWPEKFIGLGADNYRLIQFIPETVIARDHSYPRTSGG